MVKKIVEKENREPLAYLHLIKKEVVTWQKMDMLENPSGVMLFPVAVRVKKPVKMLVCTAGIVQLLTQ